MKSNLITLFIVFVTILFSAQIRAEEHLYCNKIKPNQYNDVWKQQFECDMKINYDDEKDEFVFYSAEPLTVFGFCLTRTQADSLLIIIDKYKEWNIKASKKGVKLEKEIAALPSRISFWKLGDEWSFGPEFNISVFFFSSTPKIHQMVFIFPKVKSWSNEYDSHKGEALYFGWDQALALRNVLTTEFFAKFQKELAKKSAIEDEFK